MGFLGLGRARATPPVPQPAALRRRLEGRVCIVTGAASGIGRGIAQMFAEEGAKVVVTDIDLEGARAFAADLTDGGMTAMAVAHDAGDEAAWREVVEGAVASHGRLDILVNNAASGWAATLDETSFEDWRKIERVTSQGVFIGVKTALQVMGEHGAIVNIASIAGLKGSVSSIAYGAAKSAVIGFTRSAAAHCAKQGKQIRVNAVAPGLIQTEGLEGVVRKLTGGNPLIMPVVREQMRKAVPLGFLGEPSDIAHAAVFLASDSARYITGQTLVVDGGILA